MPPPRKDDGRLSRLPYNLPPVDYSRIHLPPIKSSFSKKLNRAAGAKNVVLSSGNEAHLDPSLLSQGEHSYSGSGEKLVVGLPISSARDDDSGNDGKDELNEDEMRGDDTRSEHSDDRSRSRSPA